MASSPAAGPHGRAEAMTTVHGHELYDVLGVRRDATPEALKRAFRARARSLHPDVSADPDAAARFAELSQAYEILSRPSARLLYDRFGYVAVPRADAGRPPVAVVDVEVTPLEAERGTRRRLANGSVVAIPAGARDGQLLDAPAADGHVRVRVRERDTRLVRWAAAAGAVAASALFVALAVAPEALGG